MTDRFVTVPDSLELPAAVKVPVARLVGPNGAAATPADLGAATAAQGALADATTVEQVTLNANLAYTLPAGIPANTVHCVTFTQDGTGGHTVTYGGVPVAVESDAGAETLVEIWPGGTLTYPGSAGAGSSAAQVGTLTLPAAPTVGQTISVLADSVTVMPTEGVRWDVGGAPVVAAGEQRIITLLWTGADWVGTYSLAFNVPEVPVDTTAPTWSATFTLGTPGETTITATASALAADDTGVTGYQVSYDDGLTSAPIGASGSTFTLAGIAATAYTTTKLRAVDGAGNVSPWLAVPSYTMASPSDTTAPTWSATLTLGTPTSGSVAVTPSALATDDTAVTSYEATLDSTATPVVWTDIGMPVGGVLTIAGMAASTTYANVALRAKDAVGNASTALAVPSFTTAAPAAPPDLGWLASYYADDLALTDGDGVASWADRGGLYALAAPAGRLPVYRESVTDFGGAPTVDLTTKAGEGWPYLTTATTWPEKAQPNTFVVIGTLPYNSGLQANLLGGKYLTQRHDITRRPDNGFIQLRASSSTVTTNTGSTVPNDGLPHLIIAIANRTSSSIIVDDQTFPITGDIGAHVSIGLTVGADATGSYPSRGHVAFVGVIDGVITGGQLATLRAWARDRYGL